MSVFQEIHDYIGMLEVYNTYHGGRIKHAGKNTYAVCPFHSDKKPSMVIYEHGFKCYVCHTHGDTVDFVKHFFGIKEPLDCIRKLNTDFTLGLNIENFNPTSKEKSDFLKRREEYESFMLWYKLAFNEMCNVFRNLDRLINNSIMDDNEFSAAVLLKADLDIWTDMFIYEPKPTVQDFKQSKLWKLKEYLNDKGMYKIS